VEALVARNLAQFGSSPKFTGRPSRRPADRPRRLWPEDLQL
jgi:hypothetical protein